jgi:3-phenylpropionate/trans-cinnamate dioxygenase ferredoxin subunit
MRSRTGSEASIAVKYVVASAEEIPPGGRKIVTVAGRSIGVFNVGGEYFALRNRCPHQGGALCEGKLWGVLRADAPGAFHYSPSREILTCPWHGWEFHVRTGQSWCDPQRLRVRRFDVSVETYPVEVEETRIVLDVPMTPGAVAQRPPA